MKNRANIPPEGSSEVTSIHPERIDNKCQEKIEQGHPIEDEDQEEARERAEVGAEVAEQVRVETAFVRPAERRSLIKPEFPASTGDAPNAERLWHGSSHG